MKALHCFEQNARLGELMDEVPELTRPDWAHNWADADATRPWPPMQD